METNDFIVGDIIEDFEGTRYSIIKLEGEYFDVSRFCTGGQPLEKSFHRSEIKPVRISEGFFKLIDFDVPVRLMYERLIVKDKKTTIEFALYHGHLDLNGSRIYFVHDFQRAYKNETTINLDIKLALMF